ncbi:hypothetical protein WA026_009337 [Henosepilachna vigintioctopunctata]|uniref:Uncharacterized protein n=1 Tax=Henosepilachna vigintioctopunctata TaxID=420089 RepID=A0AAW1UW39_9CUCU
MKTGESISVEDFVEDDENLKTTHSTGQNPVQDSESSDSSDLDGYVLVTVYGKIKTSFRCYISKVADLDDHGFVEKFLKSVPQINKITITEEEFLVSRNHAILKLFSAVSSSSARFKDRLFFKDDLSDFTIY